MTNKDKRIQDAFTTVELVIVIAVISILAAVLIPTFTSIIEKAEESRRLQESVNKQKEDFIESMLGTDDSTPTREENGYTVFEGTFLGGVHYRISVKLNTTFVLSDDAKYEPFIYEIWIDEQDMENISEKYHGEYAYVDLEMLHGARIVSLENTPGIIIKPGYLKKEASLDNTFNDYLARWRELGASGSEFPAASIHLVPVRVGFDGVENYTTNRLKSDEVAAFFLLPVKTDGKYQLTLKPCEEYS